MEEWTRKRILLEQAILRKAKENPQFRERLLKDPPAAILELTGKPLPSELALRAYEDAEGRLYVSLPLRRSGDERS